MEGVGAGRVFSLPDSLGEPEGLWLAFLKEQVGSQCRCVSWEPGLDPNIAVRSGPVLA